MLRKYIIKAQLRQVKYKKKIGEKRKEKRKENE